MTAQTLDELRRRLEGKPGEHATLFLLDPSGNALEFKSFRNHDEIFSKVFDPKTKDLFGLEALVATPTRDEPSPSVSASTSVVH